MAAAGVKNKQEQFGCLVVLGFLKLMCILVAARCLDSCGRRPLMLASCFGMALALSALSMNFTFSLEAPNLAVIALAFYLCSFSLGMGPGSWLIPGELFPNTVRAKGMSLSTFINRLIASASSLSVLTVANALTWGGFFGALGGLNFAVMLFIYSCLPETKGMTLEEISRTEQAVTGSDSEDDAG